MSAPWKHRAKEGLRSAVAHTGAVTGLTGALSRRGRAGRGAILCLHCVGSPAESAWVPGFMKVSPGKFEGTLAALAREFRIVPVSDLVEALARGPLAEPTLGLTLDDGYRDNRTIAWPILRRLRIRATIYLIAGVVGERRLTWEHRLFLLGHRRGADAVGRELARRWRDPEGARRLEGATRAADPVYEVKRVLKYELPFGQVREEIERLFAEAATAEGNDEEAILRSTFLSFDEARDMAAEGIEFGSHTVSHPVLARLSAAEQAREVSLAKEILEAGLGRPVRAFAYPYGRSWDFDDASVAALREAGYASAAASMPGLVGPGTDPFRLLRIPLREETSLAMLRAALHGFYDLAGRALGVSLAGDL